MNNLRFSLRRLMLLAVIVLIVTPLSTNLTLPTRAAHVDRLSHDVGPGFPTIILVEHANGFTQPVDIASTGIPGDERLFIVERDGIIRIVESDGSVLATPFLVYDGKVTSGSSEQGMLGLVFDPDYANNGHFYVNYTTAETNLPGYNWETRISRFSLQNGDPNLADPNSELVLLRFGQPAANHNAGDLAFGPDGFLYIPTGDGGPSANGQPTDTLLGNILRIDVDGGPGDAPDCDPSGVYVIPSDNPLVDGAGGDCDEIWATGLRNPWRFSFDRDTGDLFLGDVGASSWEEIDYQPAASSGGENYGWRCYEGNEEFNLSGCSPPASYVFPIHAYDHSLGCSVVGGFVYRGAQSPQLFGSYLFADFCSANFWLMRRTNGGMWDTQFLDDFGTGSISTFGEDHAGELYVADYDTGEIYHLRESTPADYTVYVPAVLRQE